MSFGIGHQQCRESVPPLGIVLSLTKPPASVWPSIMKGRDPIIQLLTNLAPVQLEWLMPSVMHRVPSEVADLYRTKG